jgi:hypothetical protein
MPIIIIDAQPERVYYGFPTFFFRASLTSSVEDVPMLKVQWIPYIAVEHFRTCSVGRITVAHWHKQNLCATDLNPYISMQELSSSRYAISYQPIKSGDVYVEMAFIALDGDCLNASTGYCHDFGDNQISHFLSKPTFSVAGNGVVSIEDYMTPSVLKYLNVNAPL